MINNQPVTVYLGLGSNLGDREQNLEQAIVFLSERLKIEKRSPIYDTTPVGDTINPVFEYGTVCNNAFISGYTADHSEGNRSKLGRVRLIHRVRLILIYCFGDQVIDTLLTGSPSSPG
jgi:2-amino-4-hydroxy-6-hydroxymethyldihydropteridine diphosphokinase